MTQAGLYVPVEGFNLSYLTRTSSGTDTSSYTFSSQTLGEEHDDRLIIVGVGIVSQNEPQTIASVTVAGNSASSLVGPAEQDEGTWSSVAQLFVASVTTGTTGDVVVTTDTTASVCAIGLWRLIRTSSTTYATNSDTTDAINMNVNTASGGVAVGFTMSRNASGVSWTGLTEDFDADAATGERYSGASDTDTSAGSPTTVTADDSGTPASMAGVVASWESE